MTILLVCLLELRHVLTILRQWYWRSSHVLVVLQKQLRSPSAVVRNAVTERWCAQCASTDHLTLMRLFQGLEDRLDDREFEADAVGDLHSGAVRVEVEQFDHQLCDQVLAQPVSARVVGALRSTRRTSSSDWRVIHHFSNHHSSFSAFTPVVEAKEDDWCCHLIWMRSTSPTRRRRSDDSVAEGRIPPRTHREPPSLQH